MRNATCGPGLYEQLLFLLNTFISLVFFFSKKGILGHKRGEFTRIHQPLPLRTLLKGSNNFGLIQKLFLNLEIDKDIISFIIVVANLSYALLFLRSGGFYYFLCCAFKSTGFCISENVLSSEKVNRKTIFQEKKLKFWDNSWKPQLFYIKCWNFDFHFFNFNSSFHKIFSIAVMLYLLDRRFLTIPYLLIFWNIWKVTRKVIAMKKIVIW